jgi:transcriptional regulator with XRE-family HTH domain
MSVQEGLLIKNKRKQAGHTQLGLCELIGLSHAPINQVENGLESISLANLRLICDEIGLQVIIRDKENG